MISFPSIEVDQNELYEIAHLSLLKYVKNLLSESQSDFEDFFGDYKIEELKTALTKVQLTKYNHDQDLIYFDHSTKFHFEVKIHVYVIDQDNDKETLAGYMLILNSKLEVIDDFII